MAITLSTFVKLPKSRKILFLAIILAVIVGLYGYLFYLPASAEIEKKKVDMGKLETQLRELRTVAENMKRFVIMKMALENKFEVMTFEQIEYFFGIDDHFAGLVGGCGPSQDLCFGG